MPLMHGWVLACPLQYQMLPFAKQLVADNPEMELISPTLAELGNLEQGAYLTLFSEGVNKPLKLVAHPGSV